MYLETTFVSDTNSDLYKVNPNFEIGANDPRYDLSKHPLRIPTHLN